MKVNYPGADDPLGGSKTHDPVLYKEIIEILLPRQGGRYVDGTLGAGGHAAGILQASSPDGMLLGLDLDPSALELSRERLRAFGDRLITVQASFSTLEDTLASVGWLKVDGLLLDLGLSSMQIDHAGRGFSFREDAPLDMRFDPAGPVTAADLVNDTREEELSRILFEYGEERRARRIARAITAARPLENTRQLAEIVVRAIGPGERKDNRYGSRIHPATRTFQALRIAVNEELVNIETVLPQVLAVLSKGGRFAVIAYHSLEDRLVKQFMRKESKDCICPAQQPVCTCEHSATLVELTRKPVRPQEEEVERNPRSRSARMRAAEKI